jgi:hypothetical protein
MTRVGLTLGLLLLLWATPCLAQFGAIVYDPVQDANAKFQIGQTVVSLAQEALELLPVDAVVIIDTISTDISTLNVIIQEGSQIGMDIASLQAQLNSLFDLNTAPVTASELAIRVNQIRGLIWQARSYAMRVNTLVQTFQNTLRHIDILANTIAELAGNKQNLQVLNQKAASLVYVQTVQTTGQAAYYQSELYDRQLQLLIEESNRRITEHMWRDYPTSVPGWNVR